MPIIQDFYKNYCRKTQEKRKENFNINLIVGRPMRGVYFGLRNLVGLRPTNENAMKQRAL